MKAKMDRTFGLPMRSQSFHESITWYYQCSDGTVVVVIDRTAYDLVGIMIIDRIDEY